MELFKGVTAVRLRSHHNKYLVAKADAEHVSQDSSATAVGAIWTVDFLGENIIPVLRLKSCYNHYLTAFNDIRRKVLQISYLDLHDTFRHHDTSIDWRAIRDGIKVRLMTPYGSFLCANGRMLPGDSLTNELPKIAGILSNWILWTVEVVPPQSLRVSRPLSCSHEVKMVRLRSHHNMYLWAENDKVRVSQYWNTVRLGTLWTVDLALDAPFIRLKSCYDRYLTASDEPYLLGITGCKVVQTIPARLDSSVEWEPIREGNLVKLKNRNGRFLRPNGGVRPWRDSVTNHNPLCNPMKKWLLWDVQIVHRHENPSSSTPSMPPSSPREVTRLSFAAWLPDTSSRTIFYSTADENDSDAKDGGEKTSFSFCKLTEELEETQHSAPGIR